MSFAWCLVFLPLSSPWFLILFPSFLCVCSCVYLGLFPPRCPFSFLGVPFPWCPFACFLLVPSFFFLLHWSCLFVSSIAPFLVPLSLFLSFLLALLFLLLFFFCSFSFFLSFPFLLILIFDVLPFLWPSFPSSRPALPLRPPPPFLFSSLCSPCTLRIKKHTTLTVFTHNSCGQVDRHMVLSKTSSCTLVVSEGWRWHC